MADISDADKLGMAALAASAATEPKKKKFPLPKKRPVKYHKLSAPKKPTEEDIKLGRISIGDANDMAGYKKGGKVKRMLLGGSVDGPSPSNASGMSSGYGGSGNVSGGLANSTHEGGFAGASNSRSPIGRGIGSSGYNGGRNVSPPTRSRNSAYHDRRSGAEQFAGLQKAQDDKVSRSRPDSQPRGIGSSAYKSGGMIDRAAIKGKTRGKIC